MARRSRMKSQTKRAKPRKKTLPRLTHLGINVTDLDKVVAFYTRYLGVKVSDLGFSPRLGYRIAFTTASPKQHHQLIFAECRDKAAKSTVNQISFTWDTLDDLRRLARRLAKDGIPITPIDHGNAWSIYFPDPEGTTVECYLDSPWQVAQPHGHPLDLSLGDAEIKRRTRARIADAPTFMPAREWAAKMKARLAGR